MAHSAGSLSGDGCVADLLSKYTESFVLSGSSRGLGAAGGEAGAPAAAAATVATPAAASSSAAAARDKEAGEVDSRANAAPADACFRAQQEQAAFGICFALMLFKAVFTDSIPAAAATFTGTFLEVMGVPKEGGGSSSSGSGGSSTGRYDAGRVLAQSVKAANKACTDAVTSFQPVFFRMALHAVSSACLMLRSALCKTENWGPVCARHGVCDHLSSSCGSNDLRDKKLLVSVPQGRLPWLLGELDLRNEESFCHHAWQGMLSSHGPKQHGKLLRFIEGMLRQLQQDWPDEEQSIGDLILSNEQWVQQEGKNVRTPASELLHLHRAYNSNIVPTPCIAPGSVSVQAIDKAPAPLQELVWAIGQMVGEGMMPALTGEAAAAVVACKARQRGSDAPAAGAAGSSAPASAAGERQTVFQRLGGAGAEQPLQQAAPSSVQQPRQLLGRPPKRAAPAGLPSPRPPPGNRQRHAIAAPARAVPPPRPPPGSPQQQAAPAAQPPPLPRPPAGSQQQQAAPPATQPPPPPRPSPGASQQQATPTRAPAPPMPPAGPVPLEVQHSLLSPGRAAEERKLLGGEYWISRPGMSTEERHRQIVFMMRAWDLLRAAQTSAPVVPFVRIRAYPGLVVMGGKLQPVSEECMLEVIGGRPVMFWGWLHSDGQLYPTELLPGESPW